MVAVLAGDLVGVNVGICMWAVSYAVEAEIEIFILGDLVTFDEVVSAVFRFELVGVLSDFVELYLVSLPREWEVTAYCE